MGVGCLWGSSFPGVRNVKNLPVCKQSCSSSSWCIPFFFFIVVQLSRGWICPPGLHKSLSLHACGDDIKAPLLSQHSVSANAQGQCCGQGECLKDIGRYFQGHRSLKYLNSEIQALLSEKRAWGEQEAEAKNPVTVISGHRGARRAGLPGFYRSMLWSRAEEGPLRPQSKRQRGRCSKRDFPCRALVRVCWR